VSTIWPQAQRFICTGTFRHDSRSDNSSLGRFQGFDTEGTTGGISSTEGVSRAGQIDRHSCRSWQFAHILVTPLTDQSACAAYLQYDLRKSRCAQISYKGH
jgi:hypothetical protein